MGLFIDEIKKACKGRGNVVKNEYVLIVDIKRKYTAIVPTFVQHDTAVLVFKIFDNGKPLDLTQFERAEVTHKRKDGQVVIGLASIEEDVVKYTYMGNEMSKEGFNETSLTLFSEASRVSILPFKVSIVADIRDAIGSSEEFGILQDLIGEVTSVIDASEAQTDYAQSQGEFANAQGTYAKTETDKLLAVKADIESSEATRVANESARNTSEATRKSNETGRIDAEKARVVSEDTRASAESTRKQNEATRVSQEETRQVDTQTAIAEVNTAKDNALQAASDAQALLEVEPYNVTTQYRKNNFVTFNGSSYRAIQDTKGNDPTNELYWILTARKGADGTGTVSTHKDVFVATAGQKVFNLTNTYDQFQNRITVTVGGVPQFSPDNFQESTNKSITFFEAIPEGVKVVIEYFGDAVPIQSDIQTSVNNHTTELSNHTQRISNVENKSTSLEQQLADIVYPGEYFNQRIQSGEPIKVKIIGDSITAGDGADGFVVPTDAPIIFTDTNNTIYREASYNTDSWANLFRKYILSLNPSNKFYNWGIGGRFARWWNDRRQFVTDEDIVFVMLGTNDRVNSLSLEDFKSVYTSYLLYLRSVSNYVVVMAPNPISSSLESSSYKFTQADAVRVIKEICSDHNFPLISHYDSFFLYSKYNSAFDKLLADGIHPNNDGYQLYWEKIQDALSIYDISYQSNKKLNQSKVTPENFNMFSKKFGAGSYAIGSNLQPNPLLNNWNGNTLEGLATTNVNVEKVSALYKGVSAAKLTPSAANGYVSFATSLSTKRKRTKLVIGYESVGITRLQIIQLGNVNYPINTKIPEGKNILEFTFDFDPAAQDKFLVRVYPNIGQISGGYATVDFIVAVTEDTAHWGYFTDENRVDVRWFGLKGDGTDESAKLQDLFIQKGNTATSKGYTVYFPEGNYVFSGIQNLNTKVVLEGDGYETKLSNNISGTVIKNLRMFEIGMVQTDILLTDNATGKQYVLKVNNGNIIVQEKVY